MRFLAVEFLISEGADSFKFKQKKKRIAAYTISLWPDYNSHMSISVLREGVLIDQSNFLNLKNLSQIYC